MNGLFVAYYRVSTSKQGESGLGLEAQRRAVVDYVTKEGGEIIATHEEIECGGKNDRPALAQALKLCKLTGATLVIAKLNRLTRDLGFLHALQKSQMAFVVCDMPKADAMTLQVLVMVAEKEREHIKAQTRAGLASIKARIERDGHYVSKAGRTITKLGGDNGLSVSRPDLGGAAMKAKAVAFADELKSIVSEARQQGMTLRQIADSLEAQHIKTARGGARWSAETVRGVLKRLAPG